MDKHYRKFRNNVQESRKEAVVNDIYNNPKYRIILEKETDFKYVVSVLACRFDGAQEEILKRVLNKFDRAENFFRKCVEDYSDTERACGRLPQRITEFAERIGYHDVKPNCCETCKFSRPDSGHEFVFGGNEHRCRLICANGELFHPGFEGVGVRPVVDPFGICDNFERKPLDIDMNVANHCRWTWENHDCRHDRVDETVVKFEIDRRLNAFESRLETSLSGKVQTIVSEQIEPAFQENIQQSVSAHVAQVVPSVVSGVVSSVVSSEVQAQAPAAVESVIRSDVGQSIISGLVEAVAPGILSDAVEGFGLVTEEQLSDYVVSSDLSDYVQQAVFDTFALSVPSVVNDIVSVAIEEHVNMLSIVAGGQDVGDYNNDGVVDEEDQQYIQGQQLIDLIMSGGGA